jgi:DNA repair protein RadC
MSISLKAIRALNFINLTFYYGSDIILAEKDCLNDVLRGYIMSDTNKKEQIHSGHRNRMKSKYLQGGADAFKSHELLEMLLFYCVPRKDTNELAHIIINHFGSLEAVFSASESELMKISGIKENACVLISLVRELNRRCELEKVSDIKKFDTQVKFEEYLKPIFAMQNVEKLYMMMFDNSMRLIDSAFISEGTVNANMFNVRTMVEKAYNAHAANVVIAHNHPNGRALPSQNDIDTTHDLDAAFRIMGINLCEHFIVADNKCVPILHRARVH